MFVPEIEVKINDNKAYGYLFRVVKESFDIENKRFITTDVPHPDSVAQGWSPIFGIRTVDRRIYYRLMQNGWKHPGLEFRTGLLQEFQQFPRPILIKEVLRTLETTEEFYNKDLFNDGWTEIYPQNIHVDMSQFAWPRGRFYAFDGSTVDEQTLLANTCCNPNTTIAHYVVKYSFKERIGAEEK